MKAAALFIALLALAAPSWAQDQAFTGRATDLRERGAADAKSIASLPENTSVKVISRGAGGWTQVDAGGKTGWVNAFHLRFPVAVEKGSSSGGSGFASSITSIFGGRQQQQQTTVATTGIRGLSPEDLKNASPNPAALAQMQGYRSDKQGAERFAREGRLAQVDVPEGGRR